MEEHCFICFDDDFEENLLSSVCKCRRTHVHSSCLEKWVRQSGNLSCNVCKHQYDNLTVICRRTLDRGAFSIFFFCLCELVVCGVTSFYISRCAHVVCLISLFLFFFLGFLSLGMLVFIVFNGITTHAIKLKWDHSKFINDKTMSVIQIF